MQNSQQYRKSRKKRLNNFLLFYLYIILILCFNTTFSRYETVENVPVVLSVAEWKIRINNEDIEESNEFSLINTQTTSGAKTISNNKIAPDSNGYFDIILDPTDTAVSIDYKIELDKSVLEKNGINLKLTEWSTNMGQDRNAIENNTITGEILIKKVDGKTVKFTEEDTLTIRIYWSWNQDIENPKFTKESLKIMTHVTIKQKIGVE